MPGAPGLGPRATERSRTHTHRRSTADQTIPRPRSQQPADDAPGADETPTAITRWHSTRHAERSRRLPAGVREGRAESTVLPSRGRSYPLESARRCRHRARSHGPSTVHRRRSSVLRHNAKTPQLCSSGRVVHRPSTASTGLSAPCPQAVHRRSDRNAALQPPLLRRTCVPMSRKNIPTVWKSLCAKKSVTPAGELAHCIRSQDLGTTVPTTGDNHGDNSAPLEDGSNHPHGPSNGPPMPPPCPPHAATPPDLGERAVSTQLTTLTTTAGQKISLRRTKEKEEGAEDGDEPAHEPPARYDWQRSQALPWRPTHPVRSTSGGSPCRSSSVPGRSPCSDASTCRLAVGWRTRYSHGPGSSRTSRGSGRWCLSSFELRRLEPSKGWAP